MNSQLKLSNVRMMVHLGLTTEERQQPQAVDVDCHLVFAVPPKACETDSITDTYCYAKLANIIRETCEEKSFCMIEHLAQQIFQAIKTTLSQDCQLCIKVTKLKPPIENIDCQASFCYGDFSC